MSADSKLTIAAALILTVLSTSPVGFGLSQSQAGHSGTSESPAVMPTPLTLGLTKYNCEDCWAGYAGNSTDGSVFNVTASIIVPKVTTKCPPGRQVQNASGYGVFIDGFNTQDFSGSYIDQQCFEGSLHTYMVWLDYPDFRSIGKEGPHGGDNVTLSISLKSGKYHFVIDDTTRHIELVHTGSALDTANDAGECVSLMFYANGVVFPQIAFREVPFHDCEIDGHSLGSSGFSLDEFTCVNQLGTLVLARPTKYVALGFKILWEAPGP